MKFFLNENLTTVYHLYLCKGQIIVLLCQEEMLRHEEKSRGGGVDMLIVTFHILISE